MSAPAEAERLTFRWPREGGISFLLPGFVALSAFGHAAMFYIFQVAYPPTASIMPPPFQVTILNRQLPQNAGIFRWIDAEDPAAAARPAEVSPPGLMDVAYKPSYAEAHTLPQSPPTPAPVFIFPAARSALEIVDDATAKPKQFEKIAAAKTVIQFSSALAPQKGSVPEITLTATARGDLQPTTILAGVSDRGEVRYAFLQTSSGDAEIDRQAEANLATIQFQPARGASLTWEFVTYMWGAEAYAQKGSAAAAPRRTP